MSDNPFLRLKRGQSIVYHRGMLAEDAVLGTDRAIVSRARGLAWQAYAAGRVVLVQRRLTKSVVDSGCEYIAIGC